MPFRKLIKGYMDFHKAYFEEDQTLYKELASGQNPEALIIACSDSRIDPAIVTASVPGELFVVRNVAAIIPPYEADGKPRSTSAAIEFAVKTLKVKHLVVMGHSLCGGALALLNREQTNEKFDFIGPWIDIGRNTLEVLNETLPDLPPKEKQKILEKSLILQSLENVLTFPWVKEKVEDGSLKLHGWYFDFENGLLQEYDSAKKLFKDVLEQKANIAFSGACCLNSFSSADFINLQKGILGLKKTGS